MRDVVPKRLGRRGAALFLSGILWLFIAWGVYLMPIPVGRPRAPHEYLPLNLRVLGWAAAGTLAIVCAFLWKQIKDADGLPKLDRVGFAVLVVMPMERVLSWLTVMILNIPGLPHLIPLPPFATGVAGSSAWLVVCLYVLLINGWQEPITPPQVLGSIRGK